MSEYRPGEIVDITIKGVRIQKQDHHGCVSIAAEAHDGGPGHWLMPPQALVERVAPAEWPPRPGDLWRDGRGYLWFAADVRDIDETDVPEIAMVFAHEDHRMKPEDLNRSYGPLKLVHREDEQDRGAQ